MNTRKMSKILCPTDFSQFTDAALNEASTLAAESSATLEIVHVYESYDASAAMGEAALVYPNAWGIPPRNEVLQQLDDIKPTLPGVRFEHHLLEGEPVREIVAFAEREHVDLIVMGSHGRTGLSRLVMGSVAEGVTRRATCPVLIVKHTSAATIDAAPFPAAPISHVSQDLGNGAPADDSMVI